MIVVARRRCPLLLPILFAAEVATSARLGSAFAPALLPSSQQLGQARIAAAGRFVHGASMTKRGLRSSTSNDADNTGGMNKIDSMDDARKAKRKSQTDDDNASVPASMSASGSVLPSESESPQKERATPFRATASTDARSPTDGADLGNGNILPWLGYGTYKLGKEKSRHCTLEALRCGYRAIDTAFIYGGETTEVQVGLAIQDAVKEGIIASRDEVFLTSKHWRKYHGYDKTKECLNLSLERLDTDHIDLWLIHWPGPAYSTIMRRKDVLQEKGPWHYATTAEQDMPKKRSETWRAMEDAVKEGKLRTIGVSNFTVEHLKELKKTATIWPPAVNQIELHPLYRQDDLLAYCKKEGIVVQAYASLGGQDTGKNFWKLVYPRLSSARTAHVTTKLCNAPPVLHLAEQVKRTPAQVLLRWALENSCAIIPKTVTPQRMLENAALFDFRLSQDSMDALQRDLDAAIGMAEAKQRKQQAGKGDAAANKAPVLSRRLCWRKDPMRMLDFN